MFNSLSLILVTYLLAHIEFIVNQCTCNICFFINFIQLFDDGAGLLHLFIKARGPNCLNSILDYSI